MKKEEKEEVTMINLTELEVENVDGSISKVDASKEIANLLFPQATTLGLHVASQDLFKKGECEKTEEVVNAILNITNSGTMVYCFKLALEKYLA
jgi:hypothetical protein